MLTIVKNTKKKLHIWKKGVPLQHQTLKLLVMKKTQLENMKKAAEILAAFGDNKSVPQLKRYMALTAAVAKIENATQKSVVDAVLREYKPALKQLPKEIRGHAMKAFCAAVGEVLANNGTLFVFDMCGNVVAKRAVQRIRKHDNEELFVLLGNLFASEELESAQLRAVQKKEEARMEAYLEAMNDELNCYSVAQLLAA